MITGRSASRSRATARSIAALSARGRLAAPQLGQRRLLGLHEHDVEREVQERRARVLAPHDVPGVVDQAWDLGGGAGGRGELDERPHERHVVDLLQRALAPAHRRRAAAEHEDRRVVLLGRRERAHAVGDARAGGQRRHARLARDLGPALGGERRRRLVARVDDVDPLGAAAVVDREQVPARQREQLAHAVGLQPAGDQPAAVQRGRLLRLNGHGAGMYPPAGGSDPDRL